MIINFILSCLARGLFLIISPINFLYVVFIKERFTWKRMSGYLRSDTIAIDQYGNYNFRSLFNRFLIHENGYHFGNFEETISSVLGKNEIDETLTNTGKLIVKILNTIEKDHCYLSVNTAVGDWHFPSFNS